jgi:hypothetical protein
LLEGSLVRATAMVTMWTITLPKFQSLHFGHY